MNGLNPDYKRRDEILGFSMEPVPWDRALGGIRAFENLRLEGLEALFEESFIDPEDAQNSAPPAQVFLEFMRQHPEALAHGYAVSPQRDDYRVTIEGLRVPNEHVTRDLLADFVYLCKDADDLYLEYDLYSWWD